MLNVLGVTSLFDEKYNENDADEVPPARVHYTIQQNIGAVHSPSS